MAEIRVQLRRTWFAPGGVRYRAGEHLLPDSVIEFLPEDAQILDENVKEGAGPSGDQQFNWPSPSGKGIPAVQPPRDESVGEDVEAPRLKDKERNRQFGPPPPAKDAPTAGELRGDDDDAELSLFDEEPAKPRESDVKPIAQPAPKPAPAPDVKPLKPEDTSASGKKK